MHFCTMNEDSQWNEACDWVRDQVIISFRHRAIISHLSQSSSDITIEEPAEMLRIELPRELTEFEQPSVDAHQGRTGSVAQLMQQVVARLKHLEEMQDIEEQVRAQKEHRRKFHMPRMTSPHSNKRSSNTSTRIHSRRNSS